MPLRSRKTIELHLDVAPSRSASADAGGSQINRGLYRPLLDEAGYSLCEVVDRDRSRRRLTLEVRASVARTFAAEDVAAHLARLAGTHGAFCCLFGLGAGAIRVTSKRTVTVELATRGDVFAAALRSARFAPRRDRHGGAVFTGAFEPVSPRVLKARSGVELRFRVVRSATKAVALFERGDIAVSCPTAFDIAATHSSHPHFRACETSVNALVIFNPETSGALATAAQRRAIQRALVAEPFDWLGVEWMSLADEDGRPDASTAGLPETTLTFGDYWPNRRLAERLSGALRGRGVGTVQLRPTSLARLRAALAKLQFDVLLWLIVTAVPGEEGVLLWMAEMAVNLADPDEQATIIERFRVHHEVGTAETRDHLRDALLQVLPLLPLCNFRSGYLAQPWIPPRSLVDGGVYPIEALADLSPPSDVAGAP